MFLALVLATLGALILADERPAWRWRALVGVCAAAAVLVRYVGAGMVGALALWMLLQRVPWRQRWRDAATVALPAAFALGVWVSRVRSTSVRKFAHYGGLSRTLHQGASTFADWLAPGLSETSLRWLAATGVAGILAAMILRVLRSSRVVQGAMLIGLGLAAMTLVSRIVADPSIPFDSRILSPVILLGEVAIVVAGAVWWAERWPARWVAATAGTAWAVVSLVETVSDVQFGLTEGNDFANVDWRASPTVAWVRTAGVGRTLYTNWSAPLYFLVGRGSHDLPESLDGLMLHRFGDRLRQMHGVMVAFDTPNPDVARPDSIAERLRLSLVARFHDGAVWESPVDSASRAGARPTGASRSP